MKLLNPPAVRTARTALAIALLAQSTLAAEVPAAGAAPLAGASAAPAAQTSSFIRGPDFSTPWFAPQGLKLTKQVTPSPTASDGKSCTFEDAGERYVITVTDPPADSRTTRLQQRVTVTKPPAVPEPGKEVTLILEASGSVLQQGPNSPVRPTLLFVNFGAASNIGREWTVSGQAFNGGQWNRDASAYVEPVRPARDTDPWTFRGATSRVTYSFPKSDDLSFGGTDIVVSGSCSAEARWDFAQETSEEAVARSQSIRQPADPRATLEAQLIGGGFANLKACVAEILGAVAPDWVPRAHEHMDDFWRNVDNPDLDASVDAALGYSGGVGGATYPPGGPKTGQVFGSVGSGLVWLLHAGSGARTDPNARYRMYGKMLEATWYTINEWRPAGYCGGAGPGAPAAAAQPAPEDAMAAPPAAPSTLVRDCGAAEAAFDEVFLRLKATRLALERERNLHSLLDQAHEDLRQSIYAGAVVDLAALAPGWPLSSGVASRFFDEEKHKLASALLNAGLKSVETRVAKDGSLAGVGDQLTKLDFGTGLPIEGAASDVGWEGVKVGLEGAMGKAVADTSFFAFDLLKFGLSAYEGMNQLDASREMLRRVNEHISHLEQLDGELSGVLADAQSAQEYCQQQIADGRPFDTNDPALQRVRAYIGE